MKKIIFSLGTITMIVTPITIVISCDGKKDNNDNNNTNVITYDCRNIKEIKDLVATQPDVAAQKLSDWYQKKQKESLKFVGLDPESVKSILIDFNGNKTTYSIGDTNKLHQKIYKIFGLPESN